MSLLQVSRETHHKPAVGAQLRTTNRLLVLAALALVALSRLVWINRLPLLPDEAYYWDWSRRLALGYFDHPPLAAYIIHATTAIGGVTLGAVRTGMVLLDVGVVALAYALAARLGGRLAGWLALAATAFCPLYVLLSLYAAPDGPMLLGWAATVYAATLAVATGQGRYWYGAGLALGLALLSKYVAILLVPSILLYVVLFQREWLRRREPYLATFLALLVFSPNLWWNAWHSWINVGYQLGHGACQGTGNLSNRATATLIYVVTQITLVGPLLAVALGLSIVIAVIVGLRRITPHPPSRAALRTGPPLPAGPPAQPASPSRGEGRALLLLVSCAVITSLVFLAIDGLAHWAAPAYFSAIVCAAVLAAQLWRRVTRRWWGRGALAALASIVLLATAGETEYLLSLIAADVPLPGLANAAVKPTLVDPAAGWPATARDVDAVVDKLSPAEQRTAIVLADSYGTAAELGFYMRGHPHVYSSSNQYSLWGLPHAIRGPLILVSNAGTLESSTSPLLRDARLARTVTTYNQGHFVRRLDITVLRPPPGSNSPALRRLMSYEWQAAATQCEASSKQSP